MADNIVQPFDFNPISNTVKTGSYTIPAGKYANIFVQIDSGGSFTIDGTTVVSDEGSISLDQAVTNSGAYTIPEGKKFIGWLIADSGGSYNVTTLAIINSSSFKFKPVSAAAEFIPANRVELGALTTILSDTGGANNIRLIGSIHSDGQKPITTNFWVKTGTVLVVTNGRYLVTEYNNIV